MPAFEYPPLGGVTPAHVDGLSNAPVAEAILLEATHELVKRINLTLYRNSTAEQNATMYQDPWWNAGQYGLGWVYFCVVLLTASTIVHMYRLWTDKIRRALHKEVIWQQQQAAKRLFQPQPYGLSVGEVMELETPQSSTSNLAFFPPPPGQKGNSSSGSSYVHSAEDLESSFSLPILHKLAAAIRYWTYRPTPTFWFGRIMLSFAPTNILAIIAAAVVFIVLFTFVPQPFYYANANDGGPPLAVRAGMIAVSLVPWIVALSMKVNLVSTMTGIGHERLSALHRWGGYICLGLALVHMIPYYIQPVWKDNALYNIYYPQNYFWQTPYPYGTGLAAIVPLAFLCLHSLPILRSKLYELFVFLHTPASIVFVAMLFWHTQNYLTSWGYLWATVGIWATALGARVFFLNWAAFWRKSWLRGEAATVTVLPENAVKVTIPTQVRWRAGQFIYLRIPELSWLENHPFTIAALCDDKLPSLYGKEYRDMIVVFRPFAGFTRKLLNASLKNGPEHVYQAYVDGPHGGIQRDLVAFDTVVFVAGGSGITAVISHLLLLVHKMREQSAVTAKVYVIWAMKRPEAAEWFREELRICRHFAPEKSVNCEFYITAAKRYSPTVEFRPEPVDPVERETTAADLSERVDNAFAGIASKRNSALVREAAEGDPEKAATYGQEAEDVVRPLPQAHVTPQIRSMAPRRPKANLKLQIPSSDSPPPQQKVLAPSPTQTRSFEFGFDPVTASQDTKDHDIKSAGAFSSTSTAIGSPPTGVDRKGSFPKATSFFSPTSTFAGSPPTSTTEMQRKLGSPIFYSNPEAQARQEPQAIPYFPPPPTGTRVTGAQVQAAPPPAQLQPMSRANYPSGNTTGWSTEYGRPDIPKLLKAYEGSFGRRTAVFVCGPETMRRDVQSCVADMQRRVWQGKSDEVFLRVESYRL